jgi:hypothetical protein
MRAFSNKETTIAKSEAGDLLTYADLAISVVSAPKEKGFSISEQRAIFKVMDKLEDVEVDQLIELEDTEYNTLLEKLDDMKWGMAHRDLVSFSDHIKEEK